MKKTGWLVFLFLGLFSLEFGIWIIQASPLWEVITAVFVIAGLAFIFIALALMPPSNELLADIKVIRYVFLFFILVTVPRSIISHVSIANQFEMIFWPSEKILLNLVIPSIIIIITLLLFTYKDHSTIN